MKSLVAHNAIADRIRDVELPHSLSGATYLFYLLLVGLKTSQAGLAVEAQGRLKELGFSIQQTPTPTAGSITPRRMGTRISDDDFLQATWQFNFWLSCIVIEHTKYTGITHAWLKRTGFDVTFQPPKRR